MFRIGILGSENSHAAAFSKIFNVTNKDEFPDIRVVAIGGNDRAASEKIAAESQVPLIAEKPEDMLGKVDAIMVTARHGDWHPIFAKPFLEAGLPAFIDKPFACKGEEALELVRLARQKNIPLIGGSSIKYTKQVLALKKIADEAKEKGEALSGDVAAPVSMHNDYGDFYFYASHLVEISLKVFGYDPVSVTAARTGDNVSAIIHYPSFDVTNRFLNENYQYTVVINPAKGSPVYDAISLDTIYQDECREFSKMLRTGQYEHSLEELITPVYYMNALEKSWQTGETVAIEYPTL